MASLIGAADEAGAAFISDEIYHGIEYEAKAVTALEISDDAYVINSFSKYFSMTGAKHVHLRAAYLSGDGACGDGMP